MYGDVPSRLHVTTGIGKRTIKTEVADQYLLEFDAFAKAVADKQTEAPTPVSDAAANMAVLDDLFASAESGKWEAVKPVPKFG